MSDIAKYEIIKTDLLDKIRRGELKESDRVPSENKLADIYGVSVITTRKALTDLVASGHIFRIKGKGSFVSEKQRGGNRHSSATLKKKMCIVTLIVLMHENSDSSTMQIIRGVQSHLSMNGYSMVIECSHDNVESEAQIIDKCIDNDVDGVLLFSANPDANIRKIRMLSTSGIPLVLIDRPTALAPVSFVGSYNMHGMYMMTKYLHESGHECIAFAADNISISTEQARYDGFCEAVNECGAVFDDDMFIPHVMGNSEELLGMVKKKCPSAIVCVNDKCAMLVIDYLQAAGIRVPEDISVTGFDDSEMGRYKNPSLTTIRQPFDEIGKEAAVKLLELINGVSPSQTQLPVDLVVRESTRVIEKELTIAV